MARKPQNNVEYFPFLCKEGKVMFFIENKYGNNGYATWIKILRQLAVTNYHFLNLSEHSELMYLCAKCRVTEIELKNIIDDLCKLGEFDLKLWQQNKIIYSQKFIDNIQDAYKRRKNEIINLHTLCIHLSNLCIQSEYINDIIVSNSDQNVDKNTHSIVKESKVKESININSFSLPRNSENESSVLEKKSITSESVMAENEVEETKATPLPPSAPSLYASCMEVYNNFILEDTGVPAKIDGQQGKALKSIIQYLKTASIDKSDQGIIDSWKFILAYKSRWEPFHQKQITLSQINSNLINILSSIKNPNKNVKSNSVYNSSKYREA